MQTHRKFAFDYNPLNRRSEKRDDDAYIESLYHDLAARFLIFKGDIPLLKRGNVYDAWFLASEAAAFGPPGQSIFLGQECDGSGRFALGYELAFEQQGETQDTAHEHVDLRSIALQGLVVPSVLGMLGQAKSMLDWHRRHGFCANCGCSSRAAAAGWQRVCDACGTRHFPRVDPVVIMLAIDGERCLLGRQRHFRAGMYSALAGFIEPGETAEEAVRREVHEEAGIECAQVSYYASQPWPFPSSLMIGYFAHASTTDILIDSMELEDARWFSRSEIAEMLGGTHDRGLSTPKPFAIAQSLLTAYAARGVSVLHG